MIAPPKEMKKTCGKCFCFLPIKDFRFSCKSKGLRHTICRECRNQYEKDRRQKQRQTALNQGLREIRRYSTVDRLWSLTQSLIAQIGGLDIFLVLFRNRILAEKSPQRRLSGARALMHMLTVADEAKSRVLELEIGRLQEELQQLRREESPYDDVV